MVVCVSRNHTVIPDFVDDSAAKNGDVYRVAEYDQTSDQYGSGMLKSGQPGFPKPNGKGSSFMKGVEPGPSLGVADGLRTADRYSSAAILLHWVIAAAIIAEIGLGLRMEASVVGNRFVIFQIHKSIGVTILLLALARLAVRLLRAPPSWPEHLGRAERRVAELVHIGFYGLMLALPITGWLAVSSSRIAIPTLLYGVIPWPHVPGVTGLSPAAKAGLNAASQNSHKLLLWAMVGLLALHVAGALKHQLIDRRPDIGRMLPVPVRWLKTATLITLSFFAGLFLFAYVPKEKGERVVTGGAGNASKMEPVAVRVQGGSVASGLGANGAVALPAAVADGGASAAEPARPRTWTVRRSGSKLGFAVAWSQGPIKGSFERWDADIHFDPEALEASRVRVSVDLASARTDNPDADSALPGEDFFAVSRFPRAVFVASRFKKIGEDRYQVSGTLSLRGVSKAVTFPFLLKTAGDVAHMQASLALDRTLFGVGQGQWAGTDALPASVAMTIDFSAAALPPGSTSSSQSVKE